MSTKTREIVEQLMAARREGGNEAASVKAAELLANAKAWEVRAVREAFQDAIISEAKKTG